MGSRQIPAATKNPHFTRDSALFVPGQCRAIPGVSDQSVRRLLDVSSSELRTTLRREFPVFRGLRSWEWTQPTPWTPTLLLMRDRLSALSKASFNSALINRYRDGNDSVAWHADDEPELGPTPTIASVSFGASRTFQFRSNSNQKQRVSIVLEGGSLIIMSSMSQVDSLCMPSCSIVLREPGGGTRR